MIETSELENLSDKELEQLQKTIMKIRIKKIYNVRIIPTNRGFNFG